MSHYRDPVSRDCFKVRKGLCVTGDTHLVGDLVVTGQISLSSGTLGGSDGDLIPSLHDTYVIGSDQFRWAEVNAMYLSISGNAGISNNLTIGSNTNIHNNLTVDGNTLLGGELVVYDDVYLDKGATWATGGTLSSDSVFATVRSNSACWQVACGDDYVIQPTLSTYCYVAAPSAYNPVGLHYTSSSHTISVDETNTYASDRISDYDANRKTLTALADECQLADFHRYDDDANYTALPEAMHGNDKTLTFQYRKSSQVTHRSSSYLIGLGDAWGYNVAVRDFHGKFMLMLADSNSWGIYLFSDVVVQTDVWYDICVTYGSTASDIRLSVNGVVYGSGLPNSSFNSGSVNSFMNSTLGEINGGNFAINGPPTSFLPVSPGTGNNGDFKNIRIFDGQATNSGNVNPKSNSIPAGCTALLFSSPDGSGKDNTQGLNFTSIGTPQSIGTQSCMEDKYPVGARVLIITTYAPDGGEIASVGNWEFATIAGHNSDGELILEKRLSKTYNFNNYTFIANPERYNDLTIASGTTINTTPWTGSATELQGVTILAANNLTIEGSVDATESGFRGGNIAEIGANDGGRGESYVAGTWNAQARAAAYGAGGGGAYDNRGSQGDAGGQGGSGGNRLPGGAGNGWSPGYGGAAIIDSTGDKIFMGPGGGQGGGDDAYPSDTQPGRGGFGGAGGGIIILDSLNLTINGGDVNVEPQTGQISNEPGDGEPGDGGSGAGGTVVITGNVDNQGTITGADSRGSVFIFGTETTTVPYSDQSKWTNVPTPATCEDTWVGGMSASELESLVTTVQGSSAGWGGNLDISGLTDDVNDITTVVQTNSAGWGGHTDITGITSTVSANSAAWGSGSGTGLVNWTETNGHILPNSHEAYDIGSAEKKVRHLFLSDNSMWVGDAHKIAAGETKKRDASKLPRWFANRGMTVTGFIDFINLHYDGVKAPVSTIEETTLADLVLYANDYTPTNEDTTTSHIYPASGDDFDPSDYEYILSEKSTAGTNTTVAANSASWGSGGITIVGTPASGQRLAFDSTLDGYKPVEMGNYWSEDGVGNLIPNKTHAYDLGSDAKRIRHLYLQNGSMWVGESKVQSGKAMKRDINAHPYFFERRNFTEADLLQWAWDNYGLYGNADKGIAQGTQYLSVSSVPTWMMIECAGSTFGPGTEFPMDNWMYVTLGDIFPEEGHIDYSPSDYEYILEESDTASANTTVATNSASWGQGGSGGSSVGSCSAGVFVTDIKGYASIGDNNETGNCTVEHEDTVAAYSNSKPAISATTDQTVIGFDLIWNGPPDQWVGIPEVSGYAVSMSDVTKLNSYTRAFKASIQIDFNGYAGQLVTIPYTLDDDYKSVTVQFAGAPPEITNMTISDYPTYSGVQQDHFKSGDDIDITIEFDQNDVSSVRFQGNVTGSTSRSVTVVSNSATVTVPCATTLHGTGNLENISAYATNALGTEGNGYTTSSDIPVMRGPQITNMTVGTYPGSQTELKNNDKITITCEFDTMNVDRMVFSGQGWSNGSDQTKTTTVSNMSASAEFTINNSSITTGNEYEFYIGSYKNSHHTGHFEYDSGTYVSDAFMNGQTIIINNQGPTYGGFNVVYPDNTGSGGYAQQALKNIEDADVTITASNVGSNPTYQYSSNGQLSIPDQAYSATKTVSRISGSTGWNESSYNYTLQVTRAENDKTTQTSLVVKIADTNPQISVTPNNNNRMQSGGNDGTTIKDHNIRMNSDQPLLQAPTLTAPHGDLTAFSWSSGTETFNATMSVSDNYNKGVHTWGALEAVNLAGRVVTNITGSDTYEFGGFRSRDVTLVAFTNETTIDVLWTDYNKINLTWRVPTPGGGYQTMSLPTRAAAGTSAEPPTAGAWCMAEASPTAHPVTIRILDISQAGAVSQDSLITIEEVA